MTKKGVAFSLLTIDDTYILDVPQSSVFFFVRHNDLRNYSPRAGHTNDQERVQLRHVRRKADGAVRATPIGPRRRRWTP